MKLVRFGEKGTEKPGLLDEAGRVRDLSAILPDINGAALAPASIAELRALDPASLPFAPESARLGACIAGTGKIMCIGLNYRGHAAEMGSVLPKEPLLFMKAVSAVNGPYDDVLIPRGSTQMDYEVELAVIIGTKAKYVSEAEALSYVGGYAVINDVSERYFQKERGGQMTKGKSCDTFAPLGPWLVTSDEVPDPQNLRLHSEVDGARRQEGSSADMVFSVAQLVSYLSQLFTLHPGDIISTGTPAGVASGMTPPQWVTSGQLVTLGIDGLGEQRYCYRADS